MGINIKMNLEEIRLECVDWIKLSEDIGPGRALLNTVLNIWVSYNAGNLLGRTMLHVVCQ
jgi:hypothetical protein